MRNHRTLPVRNEAFALLELLLVVVVIGMLLAVWGASLNRVREKTYITLDLANFRQILKASAIYSSDNSDYMAHPTWGWISSGVGPDGWAYITSNQGRLPGLPTAIPSCEGRDVNSAQFTNQLAFFSKGQVTQYLDDGVKTTWCPKDVAYREASHGSRARQLWLARSVKVTSYAWNGTVGGYAGKPLDLNGKTYRVSQFQPSDWLMWEMDESDPFNFNDAADHPEVDEGFSRRHSGQRDWWVTTSNGPRNLSGGAIVGAFGGTAHYVRWPRVWDLRNRRVAAPNEIFNGPEYR
ncbi:MAG TPA: hypothetical protein VF773_08275 [Verrucomicrobiae bacterium]